MSVTFGCRVCWPEADVARLVEHAEGQVAAATAQLWPRRDVVFGPTVTGGGALRRQVRVGEERLCATVRPAGAVLATVVRGDHGDLPTVLSGDDGGCCSDVTVCEAEQLAALAAYSGLRVAAPTAMAGGVMFTPWVSGADLAGRLQNRPAVATELLTTLTDTLSELHHDPAVQLRQVAAPASVRTLPRVVAEALGRPGNHLHPVPAGEAGELRAFVGSLSVRLGRLAAQLDPMLFARTGVAFGNLTPSHVLYPDSSPRPVLVAPALGPGGEPADTGTLLGHLHLLVVGCPEPVRADLVEGVQAWLAGRLAACRERWREWLSAVLTIWTATVYDTVLAALTLPAAALPLDPATAGVLACSLPALSVLDVLTRELRRRGASLALNATLTALADSPDGQRGRPARR